MSKLLPCGWCVGEEITFPSAHTVAEAADLATWGTASKEDLAALTSAAAIYVDLLAGPYSARTKLHRMRRVHRRAMEASDA